MKNENEHPHYSPEITMRELETTKAESLIQRIARNVAWYALRIARPEYCTAYEVAFFRFVNIKDRSRRASIIHYDELLQSKRERYGDEPPVATHHLIFKD